MLLRNEDYMKIMQPADTLLYFDPAYKTALKDFTKEIRHLKKSVAKKQQTLVFFCIGSDRRSEERRVGKECRSRWSPYH